MNNSIKRGDIKGLTAALEVLGALGPEESIRALCAAPTRLTGFLIRPGETDRGRPSRCPTSLISSASGGLSSERGGVLRRHQRVRNRRTRAYFDHLSLDCKRRRTRWRM